MLVNFFKLILLFISTQVFAECDVAPLPPGLGGPVDSRLDVATLERWQAYRSARVEERMLEAFEPQLVRDSYRLSQKDIDQGCYTTEQLVDLGRALFLREFTIDEGLGDSRDPSNWSQRFQTKGEHAAHATSCASCHWKGGFAGAGDRVDNVFLDGDGNSKSSHIERNPIALNGIGWLEILAKEMTEDLYRQQKSLIQVTRSMGASNINLASKGVGFGTLSAKIVNGQALVDYSNVEGVEDDLVVKPFGWQGRVATIAEMVEWSFLSHLGLTVESEDSDKPEILPGQVLAISLFLATLSSPIIEIPTVAGLRPNLMIPIAEPKPAPEFTNRWALGQQVFDDIGCATCHQPTMQLSNDEFELNGVKIALHQWAAVPRPERVELGTEMIVNNVEPQNQDITSVVLFSDLKLHDMGYGRYLTRPLWGLRNSAPYSFDGGANVIDQAIEKHAHPQGAADKSATKFIRLTENLKADLRVFLYSLMREPEIRVR